jgi:hypothetical protein
MGGLLPALKRGDRPEGVARRRHSAAEIAKAHAETEFEKYRIVQDRLFESDFDRTINQIGSDGQPDIDEK